MIKSLINEYEERLKSLVDDNQDNDTSDDMSTITGDALHDESVIKYYIESHFLTDVNIEVVSVNEDSASTVLEITIEISDNRENYRVFLIEVAGGTSKLYHTASFDNVHAVQEATGEKNRIGIDRSLDNLIGEAIKIFNKEFN
jgi:hypothetical protein